MEREEGRGRGEEGGEREGRGRGEEKEREEGEGGTSIHQSRVCV